MSRVETIGDCTLMLGDGRDILPTLGKVDAVVTSPPYNLGNIHHTGNHRAFHYDDELPEPVYQAQQIEILNSLNAEHLFYNRKNRIKKGIAISPLEWLSKTKWVFKQEITWRNGA